MLLVCASELPYYTIHSHIYINVAHFYLSPLASVMVQWVVQVLGELQSAG